MLYTDAVRSSEVVAPDADNARCVMARGDAVQIFYASLSPTIVSYGTPVTVDALTLSYNGVQTSIRSSGAGQWSATFPFTLVGLPVPNATIELTLTASKNDGTSATIPIPVSVVSRTSSARVALGGRRPRAASHR